MSYFNPGPPLRGWRPPAPYPEVYLPHHRPYFYHPFMPYFVAPNYVPPYIKGKDMRALEGMGSRAVVPVATSSVPDYGPSPYQHMLDPHAHVHVSEAWWGDDFDDEVFGDDDDDLLGDVFGEERKRPFKKISELFTKLPGRNKSKAQELIDSATAVINQQAPQLPTLQTPEPKPEWSTTAKVAVGVGAAVGLITIGVMAGRALQAYQGR